MSDPDVDVAAAMVEEMRHKGTLDISLAPASALQMAAMVQLVLRHPHVPAELRATAERFLLGVRRYFADCPTVLAVVNQGDDPRNDVYPGSVQ